MEQTTQQLPVQKYELESLHISYSSVYELEQAKKLVKTHFNKPKRATAERANKFGIAMSITGYGECAACVCDNCIAQHETDPTPASVIMAEIVRENKLRRN